MGGAASRGVTDKSASAEIKSDDTNLITARAVYYGLPSINGLHTYTSGTSIYAPTSVGTNGLFLKTTGSGAPSWTSLPTATTSVAGIVLLNSATNSDSTTLAATPSAVKAAYNLANSYKGTVTSITLTAGTGISLNASEAITTSGSRTISLATISGSATTSTTSPAHGGTFTAVDTVTVDDYGRVTKVNTKTVTLPADSNTHYNTHLYAGNATAQIGNQNSVTNGNVYLRLYDDTTAREALKITGSGATTVTANAGIITITSTNTTYSGSNGVSLSGTTFSNSGVRAVEASTTNLNFEVNTNGTTSSIAIPTGKLILFGEKEYDGSEDVEIHASDVGLSGAMTFRGKITSELSEGSTANVVLEGTTGNMTRSTGDVVLDITSKEYVWDGSKWVALGLAADFALKTHIHGNIKNNGTVTTTTAIGSGMHLLITNSSDQVIASTITFDGLTTNKALTLKGTWEAVNNYSLPLASTATRGGIKIGYTTTGLKYPVLLDSEKAYVEVPWTDTHVTAVGNHYVPTTASNTTISATASGGTAEWSADVVKAVSIKTDAAGHVTGVSVTSGKLPANPGDTKVTQAGAITTAGNYPIILAYSTATTTVTNTVNKAAALTYNPGTAKLHAPILEVTTASYGETLPTTGTTGLLFFLVSEGNMYELPAGGTQGQVLSKASGTDRDVVWSDSVTNSTNSINATNATNTLNTYTSASTVKAYVTGTTVDTTGYKTLVHNSSVYTQDTVLFGAAWNDYAEFRKDNQDETQEPGRCVYELGNGVLALTTKRLQRGCEIISDTFGFAIGQDEKNNCNTPIAVSGRVLAYVYEGKEFAKNHIGWPVCSGPNGTVSVMTEEEEEKYSSRIIGTISEVPDYKFWGTKSVEVKERVWIRIK